MMRKSAPVIPISEIHPGKKLTSFYVIRKKEVRSGKNGAPYLALELGADTGRISATLWSDVEGMNRILKPGDIVKIRGSGILYHGHIQLSLERLRKADTGDPVEATQFLPKSSRNTDEIWRKIKEILQSIQNPDLRGLLELFWEDTEFIREFLQAPGGKLWHHAYSGGLIEHTLGVIQICNDALKQYSALHRDLTLTAAFLHDIGKVKEFRTDQGFIDYSTKGRMLGHISIGAQMVSEKISNLDGFPESLGDLLLHLILSHQGQLAHASPVVPKMPEAMLLYYADEMDSKINALQHVQERDREPGRSWSHYVPVLERFIYLGEKGDLETD